MEKIYDMIVVGAGPAGLSAAIYGARAKFDVLVLEKGDIGGQITITSEVVNYPGIKRSSGTELTAKMKEQAEAFGAKILHAEVEGMELSGDIKEVKTTTGSYKTLGVVLATGSNPRMIGFPGEKEYKGRGIAYCATCDAEFFTGMDVFVVGAGFAAAEEGMFLTRYARKVTIIAREPEFTCVKSIADKVLAHEKIEVCFHTEVKEVGGDKILRYAKFFNNETGKEWEYRAPEGKSFGMFVFAGYVPNSILFRDQVDVNQEGYIVTDMNRQSNIPGVFGAGDICVKNLRQVVTAVSDGAVAATALERYVAERREKLGLVRELPEGRPGDKGEDSVLEPGAMQAPRGKVDHPVELASAPEDEKVHVEGGMVIPPEDERDGEYITKEMREQLVTVFAKMEHSIHLVLILEREAEISSQVEGFVREVCCLSEKIALSMVYRGEEPEREKDAGVTLFPAILFYGERDEYLGIQYHGVPGGHEFNSFILAIYNAAGPGQPLEEELRSRAKGIVRDVNLKVAVSLSCTMCPEVVMACQRLALLNPKIHTEILILSLFPQLRKEHSIMSVPCLIINDTEVSFGKKGMEEIIDLINR